MVRYVERLLSTRAHIAGEAFSAADTQFGSGIHYALDVLEVLPDRPVFRAYLQRLGERPAFQRFMAKDLDLARAAGMAG